MTRVDVEAMVVVVLSIAVILKSVFYLASCLWVDSETISDYTPAVMKGFHIDVCCPIQEAYLNLTNDSAAS